LASWAGRTGYRARSPCARTVARRISLPFALCCSSKTEPGGNEFYVEDLVGCQVETEGGSVLGLVQGIFWNGAQDVITVGDDGQGKDDNQLLIPVVPAFIRLVDAEARRVVVAWEDPE
jgi:ribosomal 30S subunit maturation factor RimM